MEFRILGSIEAHDESGSLALGGAKPRAVLAMLLLRANEPVSAERLAVAIWGEDTPQRAVRAVQVHVSRLRKALRDPEVLTTTPAGYVLRVRPGELDVERFERLTEEGSLLLAEGRPVEAARRLRAALALWRGPALADLALEPFARDDAARLEELRLTATEARIRADLESGAHTELVTELRRLVAQNPRRERLAAQLMLALYRCGRQADALDAYRDVRRAMQDEIGLEPGRELRELQGAILAQDPGLDVEPPVSRLPGKLDMAGDAPLEGRRAELARLRARWDRARAGDGGVVVLAGAPGSGRTRLAAELAREVDQAGHAVAYWSAANPGDGPRIAIRAACDAVDAALLVLDDLDEQDGVPADLHELAGELRSRPVLAIVVVERAAAVAVPGSDVEALELAPLDNDAIRAIAMARTSPHRRDDVPIGALLEKAGGLPARAIELVVGWLREETSRHVSAVAQRAESGRADLRATEAELAGGVIERQEAVELAEPRDDASSTICPFKGLSSFDSTDAAYFFGRERLVAELIARLVGAPLLGIVGPSGSGKSSVMHAGLLPALSVGVVPGSERWRQVVIRPGEHPLRELGDATAAAGDERLLVAVDQFEETFTQCEDEAERAAFVGELVQMATQGRERRIVVLAIRADHYGRCAAYPELAGLLAPNHVLVPPMAADDLARAIERPAERCGLRVEPALTAALIADVANEPGALPLLSSALLELWQQRDGRQLTLLAYERAGGVKGAVARLAERAFSRLDDPRQEIARSVLLRLADIGEEGTVERRRVPLDSLQVAGDEAATGIVGLLADGRLLTIGAGWVELAHEALLREWPRLSGWIEEDLAGLRIQRALTTAAHEWLALDRDDGALYRGVRLAEALAWRDARSPALTALEREYLESAERLRDRERTARRRRLTATFAGMAAMIVAVSVVAVVAVSQRRAAERRHAAAASAELAARAASLLNVDPGLSLGIGLIALRRSDTEEARNVVRQATFGLRTTDVWRAHRGAVRGLVATADGRRLMTYGEDGRVRIWDAATDRARSTFKANEDFVTSAALSPDGRTIVAATFDGQVVAADAAGGRRRVVLRLGGERFAGGLDFSPDGRRLVAALSDGSVRVIDLAGGRAIVLRGHRGVLLTARFDGSGERVVTGGVDGTARVWNLASRRATLLRQGGLVTAATFSPDGSRVATAGDDGRARVWSASSGRRLVTIRADRSELNSVSFSADGKRLATGGESGVVRIWDASDGLLLSDLPGHRGGVASVVFLAGGHAVMSAGQDGTVRRWLPAPASVVALPATVASFSPDGRRVLVGGTDGRVRLWNPEDGALTVLGGQSKASFPRFSADATVVVSASWDSTIRSWDLHRGSSRLVANTSGSRNVAAMDPSGRRVADGGFGGRLAVRDANGGRMLALRGHEGTVRDIAFSPDDHHLASASDDGTARIWHLPDGRLERVLRGQADGVRSVDYSPDGRRIVTAGADGTVRVWPVDGGPAIIHYGHEGAANSARFDRAGEHIVSAGIDGTVRVWRANGGETEVIVYRHRGAATSADFSPDGRRIVSAGSDGIVRVSSCEACGDFRVVLALARGRADRDVSAVERVRFVHDDG